MPKWTKKQLFLAVLLVFGAILLGALGLIAGAAPGTLHGAPTQANATGATPEGIAQVVKANNRFAVDLYHQLSEGGENLFFSPYSISTALAMTYEGARGPTASEMETVLGFPEDDQVRRSSYASIYNHINRYSGNNELGTANALWGQEDYQFLETYMEAVEEFYGGIAYNLDFASDTEGARQTINGWVEDGTSNRITDLIPKGSLDSNTILVLTNTIYFKGEWLAEFDPQRTKVETFHIGPDRSVEVPMMRHSGRDAGYRYFANDQVQVLEMPYQGNELSMTVLLPRDGGLAALDLSQLAHWQSQLRSSKVMVILPKFTMETKYTLASKLGQMGMPSAFDASRADFSGMDGRGGLLIDEVLHKAFVSVDEKGTEAAAATAVVMVHVSGIKTPVVRADHPFIFLIQDADTGAILFLGRVVDPTADPT